MVRCLAGRVADLPGRRNPKRVDTEQRKEAQGTFRLASYNVHEFVGSDGVRDPERTSRVLQQIRADLVGLQEVHSGERSELDELARLAGFSTVVEGPTLQRRGGRYGNALLSTFPIAGVRLHDLTFGTFEPRGAIDADIQVGAGRIRLLVTHLGLRATERRFQVGRLLEILSEPWSEPVAMLGDVNEWVPFGRSLVWLHRALGRTRTARTFPSRFPLFALDRIWVRPGRRLLGVEPHCTALSRLASDHLPLVARVSLEV